jgi:RNase H-like domain found in reverse transcriptase
VPNAAQLLRPLTDALAGKRRGLTWSEEMQCGFEEDVAKVAELTHPDPAAPVSLATDASATHVGAVLQQWHAGSWWPLAFFSRKLSKAEVYYSTFDRELLAAFLAVKHFRFQLEGRSFRLYTDHKPAIGSSYSPCYSSHIRTSTETVIILGGVPGGAVSHARGAERGSRCPQQTTCGMQCAACGIGTSRFCTDGRATANVPGSGGAAESPQLATVHVRSGGQAAVGRLLNRCLGQ